MKTRPAVHSIAIELTGQCNQKCTYCYNAWREDDGASLDDGGSERLLARVRKLVTQLDIDHVTLTGGEPLLKTDIWDVLDLLRDANVGVQIISNGGPVTERVAQRLAPHQPAFVQITLNGPSAALHEEHVGEGHYDPTIRGIRALIANGVNVVGCVVVTSKNAPVLGEILELWHELGVRHVALSRFSPAGYSVQHAAELLPSRKHLMTAFEQGAAVGKKYGMQLSCTMPVPPCMFDFEPYEPIQFGFCPIGTDMQELALGPDGSLRNCTLHAHALGGVADIGANEIDLGELLRHADRTEYRKKLPEFCVGCVHADTCGGGCGAAAQWMLGDDGDRRFVDPIVWQHVDNEFEQRLTNERTTTRRRLQVLA